MSYQALYRAWRPDTFSEICDQDAVVRTLRRQVETGRIAHAYLFCGSRGTGKTTAAKVLSRAINCLSPRDGDPCGECEVCLALKAENCMDVMEIDAASNNSVDNIRELRDKIAYPPTLTKYKVYIIDEVHMLSSGAFNALLKTLEEPPKHAVFILATTDPQKLPATILSRCQRFDFQRISVEAIIERLKVVLRGINRSASDEALAEIARAAEGAMRDALSLLDVCLSFTEGEVSAALARDVLGTAGRDFMFEFTDALLACDASAALMKLDESMRRGSDPRVFSLDVASHLRGILLGQIAGKELSRLIEVTPEDAERFLSQSKRANENQLMRVMELFMKVESEMKWATQPRTILELSVVRACHPEQEEDAAMDERIARIEKMLEKGIPMQVSARPIAQTAAAPAENKIEPEKKITLPKAAAPKEYLAAIELLGSRDRAAWNMIQKMNFASLEENLLVVTFDPRKNMMAKGVLEKKTGLVEAALSEAFGANIRFAMRPEGEKAVKISGEAKNVIEQSYDIFGRENIEIID